MLIKENRGSGASLPQPSLRIPWFAAAFFFLHLVLGSLVKVHQCSQEIPSEPSFSQHASQTRFVYPWIRLFLLQQSGLHQLFLSFHCSFWLLSPPFLVIRHTFLDAHDYLRCARRGSSSPKTRLVLSQQLHFLGPPSLPLCYYLDRIRLPIAKRHTPMTSFSYGRVFCLESQKIDGTEYLRGSTDLAITFLLLNLQAWNLAGVYKMENK